jgi:retron-type reverse transcriptase
MDNAKPFGISKREVWEAYKQVRANQGAAGVDEQSIAEFEEELVNNLYQLWNRMASGSYFPSPVRRVEIPKDNGGVRKLNRATRHWDTHAANCEISAGAGCAACNAATAAVTSGV